MNYNELLGVANSASQSEIQNAFRAAAMEIHPDHNNGPEAAEAFTKIKEARDKLIAEAERLDASRDAAAVQAATATAVKATDNATYGTTQPMPVYVDELTPEELAHIQQLDRLALRYARASLLGRRNEPVEVRRHRRKIDTTNRRLDGRY